jgi:Domain of unknown function (DUF397)
MSNSVPAFAEADFHKSSYSDPDRDCVHVARRGAWVAVRDSKMPFNGEEDRWLVLPAEQFDALLAQHRR